MKKDEGTSLIIGLGAPKKGSEADEDQAEMGMDMDDDGVDPEKSAALRAVKALKGGDDEEAASALLDAMRLCAAKEKSGEYESEE